jgi:uncharacterized membrane protein
MPWLPLQFIMTTHPSHSLPLVAYPFAFFLSHSTFDLFAPLLSQSAQHTSPLSQCIHDVLLSRLCIVVLVSRLCMIFCLALPWFFCAPPLSALIDLNP